MPKTKVIEFKTRSSYVRAYRVEVPFRVTEADIALSFWEDIMDMDAAILIDDYEDTEEYERGTYREVTIK